MTTVDLMSKDRVFHFRLDEADRERLDALAEYYSAPAATVVRILVKEKARELGLEPATAPKVSTPDELPAAEPTPTTKTTKAKTRRTP